MLLLSVSLLPPVLISLLSVTAAAAVDVREVRSILTKRVESGRAVGIVVGIIAPGGQQIIAAGRITRERATEPDGETVFEIGSITKIFTSLALADMIEKGEVTPDEPVAELLPSTVKVPSRGDRSITLLDLSMHVSGLPRLPSNLHLTPANLANPYADYGTEKLYQFLSKYKLTRKPGETYLYSNLGAGLLGHALALKDGISYERLIQQRILQPLGMSSTTVRLSESQMGRLAQGYGRGLNPFAHAVRPVKNWDFDVLAGAGALRSTADDMLKFLAANLNLIHTPLAAAMRRMQSVRRETGRPNLQIAMGWHILTKYDREVYWHNGGTAGYRSFVGFNPTTREGVVVLCNTSVDNDDLGRHILGAR